MFNITKNIKIVTVDKGEVKKLASTFKTNIIQISVLTLLSLCIAGYVLSNYYIIVPIQNIVQMDIEQLNEYINEDKAKLVYNYIKENGLDDYEELEEINGISFKTIEKLRKFTYIKGVN